MSEDSNGAARAGSNSGDPKEMAKFVTRIENLNDEKASIMGEAKQRCKVLTDDINVVLDEAKDVGIPKKSVRAVVKTRALEKKAAAEREKLEEDQLFYFDQIVLGLQGLEDTPLGQAAIDRAAAQHGVVAQTAD